MKFIQVYERFIKNKWEILLSNPDKVLEGDRLIDLVSNAYKKSPMGSFVKTISDVVKSHWDVIDWDENPDVDACIFFRGPKEQEKWIGKKIQGVGHNGHSISKKYIISKLVSRLKENGTWIEASGKLEETLEKYGCEKVTDLDVLNKLFPGSGIRMVGNRYERKLSNGDKITESVFGIPKFHS